jgi:hypothetical protein
MFAPARISVSSSKKRGSKLKQGSFKFAVLTVTGIQGKKTALETY